MTYTVKIEERDFSIPIIGNYKPDPVYLSWSAYGGPHIAHLKISGSLRSLFETTRLLRSPVEIYADDTAPVWWGFVSEITIYFGQLKIFVSLDRLINRVKVQYSFISPDNHLADQSQTTWVDDLGSQTEFGIKEFIIHRSKIDDDFAENLRDTVLSGHAWPETEFSQSFIDADAYALVKCSGWFETLSWKYYENLKNFYANYGPAPGTFEFDMDSSHRRPSQIFTANANGSLQYVYFQVRKIGSPTGDLKATVRDATNTSIGTSAIISPASVSEDYAWLKFTFSSPPSLVSGATYKLNLFSTAINAANFYAVKTDENQGYSGGYAVYWDGAAYVNVPSITHPARKCDLIFRAVLVTDTGDQLAAIATSGNQFFTKIDTITSGVNTSPYRANGYSCLREIQALMNLGTSNNRLILASVNYFRQLEFYEQPDPKIPTVFLNDDCVFYTSLGQPLKPYLPPVGQFAAYLGSSDLLHPFDQVKAPPAFISLVEIWPETGGVKIHSTPSHERL